MNLKSLFKDKKEKNKAQDLKNKGTKKKTKHFIGGETVTDLHQPKRKYQKKVQIEDKIDTVSVEEIYEDNKLESDNQDYELLNNTEKETQENEEKSEETALNTKYENLITEKYTPIPLEKNPKGRKKSSRQIYKEFERLIKNNHSKNTVKSYKQSIKFWNEVANTYKKPIYRLRAQDIEEAVAKYSPRTKNSKIVALKLLGKIYLRNNLFELPVEIQRVLIKSKPAKEVAKYINEDDYKILKKQIKKGIVEQKREYLWLGLFLFCGLRISEVETITIQDSEFIKVLGKGNKERIVPCLPHIIDALKTIKEKGYGGWRVNGRILDKHLRRNGYLENFHCHQLRHTYATYLYRKGVDLNTLKELLGHETILTTQIYAKSKVDKSILKYL